MKITNRQLRRFCYYAPIFCSIAVLSTQLQAGPTIQLNGDESRDGIADSGRIGYVGGNTRIGVSVDKDLEGQVDINQIVHEDDSSATSVEGWFGYKFEDDERGGKGLDSGGVKINHQWANDEADTVHKVFGAYDENAEDLSKVTIGYGQETEDLFWAGRISKGFGDEIANANGTETRGYDYGVGAEVGTFLESTQTRIRGGLDYEFGTEHDDSEDRPTNLTISAGVEQFFYDTPHSISLDVSGSRQEGGADSSDTDYNARLGYRYEFGGGGAYQSDSTTTRRRVEIPGTPARPGRAGRAGIPGTRGTPAVPGRPAIAAQPGRPAQPAVPPKYERQLVKKPGHEFVKTTMKLENETFFKLNSSQLTKSAKNNLNKIVGQVRGHGYVGAIRITGNTCGLGDPIYDQRLSENRANAVRDYLVEQGFNPEHLIARGLGKGSPKYNRQDDDFKNRRVDLEFMTERSTRKQTAQSYYKNVLVQEGRPAIPGIAARPGRPATAGRPAIPGRAAVLAIPAIPATPGTPSRFVWKTEVVKAAPIWIKRAVRNTIKHDRTINTYTTRAAIKVSNDSFTLTNRDGLLDVLGNDNLGTGSELISVTQPSNGTVTIVGDQVRYVPRAGFSGSDSFTYTVRDRDGNEQTATVNIDVPVALNNAPVAVDDVDTTPENTAITINALSNDTDTESDPLTVAITGNPTNGTASVVNGQIVYTPTAGFVGTDTITYSITDPDGESDTATITITVSNVNGAPTPSNDSRSTPEDTPITIDVLTNDSDPDGDSFTLTSNTAPIMGSASINGNNIVYTPNPGFAGTDIFDYTVTDSNGATQMATVTVTVVSVNKAPTPADDNATTPQDTPVTMDVLANDTDPDGDSLTITSDGSAPNGTTTTSGNQIVYTPDAGFTGVDSYTYTVSDGNGNTATAVGTVTVTPVANQAPTANDETAVTHQDTAITLNVIDNDTDPEGDTLTITSDGSAPNGTTTTNGSNQIVYTPDAGFTGTDSFTYTISDGNGNTDTATVTVTVNPTKNESPVANNESATTPQDTPITLNVIGNDTDPEGDTLTIISDGSAPNGNTTTSGNQIVYTPESGFSGEDSFTYTISDGNGGTDTATVTVTVTPGPNEAPIAGGDSANTEFETPVTINVALNDFDPDGTTTCVSGIASNPTNGSVVIESDGVSITYTPFDGFFGFDTFVYTACDADGATDTATVHVAVFEPK